MPQFCEKEVKEEERITSRVLDDPESKAQNLSQKLVSYTTTIVYKVYVQCVPLTESFLMSGSRSRRTMLSLTFKARASAITPPVLMSFSRRSRRSSCFVSAIYSASATAPSSPILPAYKIGRRCKETADSFPSLALPVNFTQYTNTHYQLHTLKNKSSTRLMRNETKNKNEKGTFLVIKNRNN